MKKFKKGDLVTVFGVWTENAGDKDKFTGQEKYQTFYYRPCVVTSWGKKQGTLIDAVTKKPIKVQVYEDYANHIFAGHDPDVGMAWCQEQANLQVASLRRFADRFESGTQYPWVPDQVRKLRKAADEIEAGEWQLVNYQDAMGGHRRQRGWSP